MSALQLHIFRGVPGSGKSTLARELGFPVVEADQFFTDEDGNYNYDPAKIPDAHDWCQAKVEEHLARGQSVSVANVFSMIFRIETYIGMAMRHKAAIYIHECTGRFQNIHGCPDSVVESMRQQWEEIPPWYQHYLAD
ncbi:MAG: hypothetical protein J6T92_06530 [Ottowia sp.]|nr:hypothetical protein [Ottowia sp.]